MCLVEHLFKSVIEGCNSSNHQPIVDTERFGDEDAVIVQFLQLVVDVVHTIVQLINGSLHYPVTHTQHHSVACELEAKIVFMVALDTFYLVNIL